MADEPIAASSAAVEQSVPIAVEDFSDEQHATWLKTGELPAKPKSGESATPKPADAAGEKKDASADGKTPESGTGTKNKTEERFNELLKDRKEAKERADRLETELAELRKKVDGGSKDVKAESSTANAEEPKAPERPKRPVFANFGSPEEFDAAMDKYETELLEHPAKESAFNAAKAQAEKSATEWKEREVKQQDRIKELREKHPNFDELAKKATELTWEQGSPAAIWAWKLQQSDPVKSVDFGFHFAQNPDEFKRIAALPWDEQMDALTKVVRSLGAPPKKEEPPKKDIELTAAKKPPSEVGGKGTAPEDEEAAALKAGDVDRYMHLANKRDIASRKKAGAR